MIEWFWEVFVIGIHRVMFKCLNLGLRICVGYEAIDESVQVHHCIYQRAHIAS